MNTKIQTILNRVFKEHDSLTHPCGCTNHIPDIPIFSQAFIDVRKGTKFYNFLMSYATETQKYYQVGAQDNHGNTHGLIIIEDPTTGHLKISFKLLCPNAIRNIPSSLVNELNQNSVDFY